MIEAASGSPRRGTAGPGTLLAVFVADEEIASDGAKLYAATKPRIDFAVVGEPTGNAIVTAHKGSLRPLVRVHGVSAHSGTPHLGENAIFKAAAPAGPCRGREPQGAAAPASAVGAASLTVTRIHGGHADNVLPGRCDLLLDRRMVPGEDEERGDGRSTICWLARKREFGVRAEIVEWHADHRRRDGDGRGSARSCRRPRRVPPTVSAAGPLGFQGGCDLVHFRGVGADGNGDRPGRPRRRAQARRVRAGGRARTAVGPLRDVARAMLRP